MRNKKLVVPLIAILLVAIAGLVTYLILKDQGIIGGTSGDETIHLITVDYESDVYDTSHATTIAADGGNINITGGGATDDGFALHWLPESNSYEYVWGDYALHFDGKRVTAAYSFRTDSTFASDVLKTMPAATLNRMERHMKSVIQQYMQRMTSDDLVIKRQQ